MLDTKTKTLSWACDSRSPWTVTYMRVAGAGSLQRVCVCVCMHVCVHTCVRVCWGEGAVYRWVEERSSELHSEEAGKEEDQECGQQSSVVLETCL